MTTQGTYCKAVGIIRLTFLIRGPSTHPKHIVFETAPYPQGNRHDKIVHLVHTNLERKDGVVPRVAVSRLVHAYSRASIGLLASSLLAMRSCTHGSHT